MQVTKSNISCIQTRWLDLDVDWQKIFWPEIINIQQHSAIHLLIRVASLNRLAIKERLERRRIHNGGANYAVCPLHIQTAICQRNHHHHFCLLLVLHAGVVAAFVLTSLLLFLPPVVEVADVVVREPDAGAAAAVPRDHAATRDDAGAVPYQHQNQTRNPVREPAAQLPVARQKVTVEGHPPASPYAQNADGGHQVEDLLQGRLEHQRAAVEAPTQGGYRNLAQEEGDGKHVADSQTHQHRV